LEALTCSAFDAYLQGRTIRYAMLMVVVTYQSVAGTYCDITDFKPSWRFIINIDPVLEYLHHVVVGLYFEAVCSHRGGKFL